MLLVILYVFLKYFICIQVCIWQEVHKLYFVFVFENGAFLFRYCYCCGVVKCASPYFCMWLQDGDYNKVIPAMYCEDSCDAVIENASRSQSRDSSKACHDLCSVCRQNQLLKIKQLANFVPQNEVWQTVWCTLCQIVVELHFTPVGWAHSRLVFSLVVQFWLWKYLFCLWDMATNSTLEVYIDFVIFSTLIKVY